jgi:hypothetical protein
MQTPRRSDARDSQSCFACVSEWKYELRCLSSAMVQAFKSIARQKKCFLASPAPCIRCTQEHAFANRFSRDWRLLKKDKKSLRGYPNDQQEAASRYSQHDERPEMMILRLPAQWAFFFHGLAAGYPLAGDHRRSSHASDGVDGKNRSVVSWMKAKRGSHCGCSILR